MTKRLVVVLIGSTLCCKHLAFGQVRAESEEASRLVWQISHPYSGPPPQFWSNSVVNPKYPAQRLAALGSRAVPAIEKGLSSLEVKGLSSDYAKNSGWLLLAYAKVVGPSSRIRLESFREIPSCEFLYSSVDRAIALALNLTSYVSAVSGFGQG